MVQVALLGETLAKLHIAPLRPQVACVAEADGGLLSIQEQIDVTRRRLNTSEGEAHRDDGMVGLQFVRKVDLEI